MKGELEVAHMKADPKKDTVWGKRSQKRRNGWGIQVK